jgi:hypothetical protein
VTLELPLGESQTVSHWIMGPDGRLLHHETHPNAPQGTFFRTIQLGDFPAGIYLLRIAAGGHTRTEKLVITR